MRARWKRLAGTAPGSPIARRIAVVNSAITVLIALVIGIPAGLYLRDGEAARISLSIQRDSLILATDLSGLPEASWRERLFAYERQTEARVTLVDTNSRLLFDTSGATIGGAFVRAEITGALRGEVSTGTRVSLTLGQLVYFSAVPVRVNGQVVGALRVTLPATELDEKISPLVYGSLGLLVALLAVGLLASWLVAVVISRPLEQLAAEARRVGDDPSRRIGEIKGPREVRQVGVAMDETAARLEAALQRSRAVAAEVSHHLRTPLAALRLRIEAISDLGEGQVREEAESALIEVDRLNRRIEQILAIARTMDRAARVPVDVGDTMTLRVGNWEDVALSQGITVTSVTAKEKAYAELPPGTVERAVDELVSNALAYAKAKVTVACGGDAERVWLDVSDDGRGIPADERELVFERFVRGSQARPGGTGLGLAMLREAARAVGGDALALEVNPGATVRVVWPRCKMEK